MPSYLMAFYTGRDIHRVVYRYYTIRTIEKYLKNKPISSLQSFINFVSSPKSMGYIVFLCVVSAIGVFGEYA